MGILLVGIMPLAACDDPGKACIETADRTSRSEDQIAHACDCEERLYRKAGLSLADREVLAAIMRGRDIPLGEEERAKELALYRALAKASCRR